MRQRPLNCSGRISSGSRASFGFAPRFRFNERGCGSEQFPPHMMLALLIYCYSHGIFGSRRIEAATHQHLSVRYLAGNVHPDHDTICKFRRENFEAIAGCFLRVLELARELGLLRVGTVAIDGTRLRANAGKHRNITYARAGELIELLKSDIAALLGKAENADVAPAEKETLPAQLARREALRERLAAARAAIEERARQKAQSEPSAYEAKVAVRAGRPNHRKGPEPQPPRPEPEPGDRINLTDADNRWRWLTTANGSAGCAEHSWTPATGFIAVCPHLKLTQPAVIQEAAGRANAQTSTRGRCYARSTS